MARPGASCRLTTLFGCIPLDRGVLIIGIFSMFMSLMVLFKISLDFVDSQLSFRHCQRQMHDMNKHNLKIFFDEKHANETNHKCPNEILQLLHISLGVQAILWIIYFIVSALLVYGVKLSKPKLILPWMLLEAAPLFYSILSIFNPIHRVPLEVNLFTVFISGYLLLVVYSYYKELQGPTERQVAVTVVAVTQTPMGMTVSIPSNTPGKDDAPPPYPGYISELNPAYSSSDEMPVPSYSSLYGGGHSASPPPYSESPAELQPHPTPSHSAQSAQTSSQNSPTGSPCDASRELTPLVKKTTQFNE